MKNNQNPKGLASRRNNRCHNQQPRQNNRQNHPVDITEMVKGVKLIGADIAISEGATVTVTRDEYDELLYCSALVDILQRLHAVGGKYASCDLLDNIFSDDTEKEDK